MRSGSGSGVVRRGTSQDPADDVVPREAFSRVVCCVMEAWRCEVWGLKAQEVRQLICVSLGFSVRCEFGLIAGC